MTPLAASLACFCAGVDEATGRFRFNSRQSDAPAIAVPTRQPLHRRVDPVEHVARRNVADVLSKPRERVCKAAPYLVGSQPLISTSRQSITRAWTDITPAVVENSNTTGASIKISPSSKAKHAYADLAGTRQQISRAGARSISRLTQPCCSSSPTGKIHPTERANLESEGRTGSTPYRGYLLWPARSFARPLDRTVNTEKK